MSIKETVKEAVRTFVRPTFRKSGYDICSAEAWRDPLGDIKRSMTAPAPIIFDVGANVGDTVHTYRKLFPSSTVHAFEPGEDTYQRLDKRFAGDQFIHLNNFALGASAGKAVFHENKASVMSSFLELGPDGFGAFSHSREVTIDTIDSYCTRNAIDRIDLVKLDTQGFDLQVIDGASRMLPRIHMLFVEVTFLELYKNATPGHEILSRMHDRGFEIAGFYHFSYRRNRLGWMDALFVNKNWVA